MHLTAIPRHQLEITWRDYISLVPPLARPMGYQKRVNEFEREFAQYVGARHAIAMSSGRLGVHLLLEALPHEPGDEVIVPAFNLSAVIERFCQFGLIPKFADVSTSDLCLDPDSVEAAITPRTRLLLATHMFGHPADMTRLCDFAARNNLVIIEDCAHALGTRFQNRHVGTFGAASIFSFSVLKLVTTFGGGMITTNDDALALNIRGRLERLGSMCSRIAAARRILTGSVMDFGTRKTVFSFGAWPALRFLRMLRPDIQKRMMTELPHQDRNFKPPRHPSLHPTQAVLGQSQLHKASSLIQSRREVGQWLDTELANIPQLKVLSTQQLGEWNGLYYGILCERAHELAEHLFKRGIDAETSEYRDCSALPMYAPSQNACRNSKSIESRIIRIPNCPSMKKKDARRIANAIQDFYAPGRSAIKTPPAKILGEKSLRPA